MTCNFFHSCSCKARPCSPLKPVPEAGAGGVPRGLSRDSGLPNSTMVLIWMHAPSVSLRSFKDRCYFSERPINWSSRGSWWTCSVLFTLSPCKQSPDRTLRNIFWWIKWVPVDRKFPSKGGNASRGEKQEREWSMHFCYLLFLCRMWNIITAPSWPGKGIPSPTL